MVERDRRAGCAAELRAKQGGRLGREAQEDLRTLRGAFLELVEALDPGDWGDPLHTDKTRPFAARARALPGASRLQPLLATGSYGKRFANRSLLADFGDECVEV